MIHLIADERHACAHAHGELTVGSRGIPVQVGLSDDFDGLAVTICFQAGTERAEVVWYEGEEINVPPQCLTKEGERLLVGVYGAKADGTVVIPTIWATAGIVKRGTDLTGVSPLDPEPDWTAQVQSIAAEAIETANSVRADADAGEFDGFSPTASVTQTETGATVTVTDRSGTTTAQITNGATGPQGERGPQGPKGERGPQGPKGDTGDGATRIEYGSGIILVQCDADGRTNAWGGGFDVRAYVGAEQRPCTAAIGYAPSWLTINVTNNASGTPAVRYSWQQGQAASNATVGMTVTTTDVSGTEVTYQCTLNVTTVRDGAAGADGEDGYGFVPVDGTFVPIHTNPDNTTRAGRHELVFEAYSGSEELDITCMTLLGPSWLTATQSSIAPRLLVLTWPDGETLVDSVGCSLTLTIDDHGTTRYEYSEIVVGAVKDGADGYSPTVTVAPITGGHEVTVTDAGGSQSFDVMDGKDGGQKLTGVLTGETLAASDAYAAPPVDAMVYGASTQSGTPTPSSPVPILSVDALTLHAGDGTTDATEWPVAIDLQGHELRGLPDGTRDELTLTPERAVWRVTLTQRVGSTTTAATDGITGTVGVDVMSTTGEIADGPTVTYPLATERTIDLGTVTLPALPAPDMTVWANGGSAQPSLDVTYERDANMAESSINAEIDGLHDDVTGLRTDTDGLLTSTSGLRTDVNSLRTDTDDLRTDTDGLLANVAQIPSMLSQQLTAGAAGGITGGGPTDSAAWTERITGGGDASDGPATIESIHGRTVVWNQLLKLSYSETRSGVTFTKNSDGSVTVTGKNETSSNVYPSKALATNLPTGHIYLVRGASTENANVGGTTGGYNLFLQYNDAGTSFSKQYGDSGLIITPSTSHSSFQVRIQVGYNASITFNDTFYPQLFDLTLMFGAGNEPSTVAEFERMFPEPYYLYDAGSLLSVNMTGVESVGFNQWNEQWEVGNIAAATGEDSEGSDRIRSKGHIPVLPGKAYYITSFELVFFYDSAMSYLGYHNIASGLEFTTPSNASYVRFRSSTAYGATYKHDICFNISDPTRNGEYEPYWKSERGIPAATYFPQGMRSAGSVYDELTADAAVTRVGSVDLGTLTWTVQHTDVLDLDYFCATAPSASKPATSSTVVANVLCRPYRTVTASTVAANDKSIGRNASTYIYVRDDDYSDAASFRAAMSGVMLHYALATPTTTPIDPPLNLTYRAEQGGTERITHTNPTAPPTLAITYGSTADSIRDRVLSAIAPVENGRANANYAVGSYLIHDGQLCKVTTAIASGEEISIGTNVTATTVMAEVIALTQ